MKEYDKEVLRDLIIDGIECGTNYWALIHNGTERFRETKKKGFTTSETIADIILVQGESVLITDIEGEVEIKHELSLTSLLDGIRRNEENRPDYCDLDYLDAEMADCIFQYAIFEDIIFS